MGQSPVIVERFYGFLVWIFERTSQYPTTYRYSLGGKIQQEALAILEHLVIKGTPYLILDFCLTPPQCRWMARIARVVAPGFPHHVTQRGNRRQETFFSEEDYEEYIRLMSAWCSRRNVDVWAYCLMPNHVHLIVVPQSEEGLRRAIGEAHRRYTHRVNFREGWRGHLWQGRFASFPLDERYLLAATRYVELNPVRAGIVKDPVAYPWSSAAAHISGSGDELVKVKPLLEMVGNWRDFLQGGVSEEEIKRIRRHERTGRPLGNDGFVEKLEEGLRRILKRRKPGPKRGHKHK